MPCEACPTISHFLLKPDTTLLHRPITMKPFYELLGVSYDPTYRYTTSWILPPIVLAIIRLVLALYAFTTIFFIFGWDGSHRSLQSARQSFSFFTSLTYWGIAFYFLFSGLHTLSYARTGRSWLHDWGRPLQASHAIFYTTVTTYPVLVTVVFWVLLYSGSWFPLTFNAWSNVCF